MQKLYKTRMDRKAFTENLHALATTSKGRSKAAQLRDVLDDVEAAFAAGVTHSAVLAALQQQGIEMTPNTFEGTLKRLRTQRLRRRPTPANTAASDALKAGTPAPSPTPAQGSLDPADLDKIFRSSVPDMNALAKAGRERLKKK